MNLQFFSGMYPCTIEWGTGEPVEDLSELEAHNLARGR